MIKLLFARICQGSTTCVVTNTMLDTSSDTLYSNLSFVSKLINDDYQLFYNSKFLKSKVYDKIGLLVGAIVGILLM